MIHKCVFDFLFGGKKRLISSNIVFLCRQSFKVSKKPAIGEKKPLKDKKIAAGKHDINITCDFSTASLTEQQKSLEDFAILPGVWFFATTMITQPKLLT